MLAAQDLVVTVAALGAGALFLRRIVGSARESKSTTSCPGCEGPSPCAPAAPAQADPAVRPLMLVRKAPGPRP
jgi:hypothetical protein